MAVTMLGSRAFDLLNRKPLYPFPTASYTWDWIFPSLHKSHTRNLLERAAKWPSTLRLPVLAVASKEPGLSSAGHLYSIN